MTKRTVPRGTIQATATLAQLPVDLVDVGANVRVDPGELEGLAASFRELGVLQPVRAIGPDAGGRYRLVWGQRRLLAARMAELATIPALVEASADVAEPGPRRSIEQLAENLQRADLNPIDEAKALRAVLDGDTGLTQVELARRLGRSAPWISNALRLLGLDEAVQAKVAAGDVSASHAKAIVTLPPKQQRQIAERVIRDGMSAKDLERELEWKRAEAQADEAKARKTEKWIPKAIAALEAAGIAKDAGVLVTGSHYDTDIEAVRKAISKAGWRLEERGSFGYGYGGRPLPEGCDCTAVEIAVGGRKAEIERRCVERRHVDRQANLDHLAKKTEDGEAKRHLEAIGAALAGELERVSLPILRVLAHATCRSGGAWADWAALASASREELVPRIVEHVATRWMLSSVDLAAVVAELGDDVAPDQVAEGVA